MHRKIIPDVVRDQKLIHLTGGASVHQAALLMRQCNVGSVLVMANGRLQGIFTERDMVVRVVAEARDPSQTSLEDVMTPKPDMIAPGTTAIEALRRMHDGGYRHLPVVAEGRVVGVVSRRDFLGTEKVRLEDENATWERIG